MGDSTPEFRSHLGGTTSGDRGAIDIFATSAPTATSPGFCGLLARYPPGAADTPRLPPQEAVKRKSQATRRCPPPLPRRAWPYPKAGLPARVSELRDGRARNVLVLLGGPATHTARALDHAVANDGHRALARDHVPTFSRDDALDDGSARALGQLATGPREGGRGDGLALGAVDTAPDGAVHAIERHQAPAGVAHRHADLDVHLPRLGQRRLHDLVGFCERQSHGVTSIRYVLSRRPTSSITRTATSPPRFRTVTSWRGNAETSIAARDATCSERTSPQRYSFVSCSRRLATWTVSPTAVR